MIFTIKKRPQVIRDLIDLSTYIAQVGKGEQINTIILNNITEQEIKILQQHQLIKSIMAFIVSLLPSSVVIN
jgi:hypothetical protein